ncbi:MAG: hypothetical protein AB1426_12610 [Bacillota bacterium]
MGLLRYLLGFGGVGVQDADRDEEEEERQRYYRNGEERGRRNSRSVARYEREPEEPRVVGSHRIRCQTCEQSAVVMVYSDGDIEYICPVCGRYRGR